MASIKLVSLNMELKMKQIKIPIHSFIDVITNSSTEIFVQSHKNTIKYAKELINTLLKAGGCDKKAEDLFEFNLEPSDIDTYDYRIDDKIDENNLEDTKENREIIAKEIHKEDIKEIMSGNYYEEINTQYNLVITAKDDSKLTIDLTTKIEKIFSIEEHSDG